MKKYIATALCGVPVAVMGEENPLLKHLVTHPQEVERALVVAGSIGLLYGFMVLVRHLAYRYATQVENEERSQRYFAIKKLSNILFVILSVLIIALVYTKNLAQGMAVFGVIGAGLTIVLKELVLSMVSWMMMMASSSIRLGDRIKIDKDGKPIIGDVIDISLTKITLYENITNDSITDHKKAGRIIFVPNYFMLTHDVYNYTHLSMKTIIDLVEINLSFDTNIEKTEAITFEIVESISGRYTDMAKRQYDMLKDKYTLRNMTNYPKVVFYPSFKGDGVTMGIWYVTPYREILRLKSELTKQVIGRLRAEEDIHLMYTGASMYLETSAKKEELVSKLTGH
ncbi:MAG: mechanosensitive ion channel [Campylobacterales bacterium]|nr:mechanosensitive ion channel [Campylobacterales bacterium]